MNNRLRVVRNTATCNTTEAASATNSAPITTISSSVRVVMDNPASRPPSASDPVSPIGSRTL
ncbi:Uncharacterised protein [Mycobacteroides abscessus subsp. abscessus]|nr:Uncharacterised protein [Mycobacteroides abscessus subsp. abscessus]